MAAPSVTFNGTRLNSSDSNTGWGNFVVGGGAPASEPANAYQQDTPGSTVGAVGKKVNSTTARQGVDYNGTSVDYSTNGFLWFAKVYVADGFNVNVDWGVELAMGSSDTGNSHRYNVAGLSANNDAYTTYPAQGGYIITAIDPTIDGWAESADDGGVFDQTGVVWYAVGAQFITGEAKSENVAMDAIDYGTGLTITQGESADPGTFIDYVTTDQGNKSNRWGVVTGQGANVRARGLLTVSSGLTVTEFNDESSIVSFVDGYHSEGKVGVAVNMNTSSTLVNIGSLLIGEGKIYDGIADTRPDFTVSGVSGSFTCDATLRNFRNVTLTSVCDVNGATIQCQQLTQANAEIQNTTIQTYSLSGVACLQDPSFGTTSGIHDTTFVQTGSGLAMEIALSGTYDLTNVEFTGYGAISASDAALDITATAGTVTININGGNTPTYRTAGATVVINNTVSVAVKAVDVNGDPVTGGRVLLEAATGGDLAVGTDIIATTTDVNGDAVNAGFSYTADQPVSGWIRKSTTSPLYKQGVISGTITSNGFSTTVVMISDE